MSKTLLGALIILILLEIGGLALYHSQKQPRHVQGVSTAGHSSERDILIDQRLSSMSIRDKVASLFIFHTPGTDYQQFSRFLDSYKPGGLILMGDNMPATRDELRSLTGRIKGSGNFPPLLAIDEEGGTVKRIASDTFAAGAELADAPVEQTISAFAERSQLLSSVGIPLNFGIIADTTGDTSSFIAPRILGTNPAEASVRVAAAVQASKSKTYTTLKHFPGHGETTGDSHVVIPTTDISLEAWRQRDKPPFQAGIDAGATAVMIGHLRYSSVDDTPASLSKKWYGILKNEMGFTGIAITDDMLMLKSDPGYTNLSDDAVQALKAGATMLLYVTDNGDGTTIDPAELISDVTTEVQSGHLDQKMIDANVRKVLEAQYDSRRFFQQK